MNIKSYTLQGLALLIWVGTIAISGCKPDVNDTTKITGEETSLFKEAYKAYRANNIELASTLVDQALAQAKVRKAAEDIAKCIYLKASIFKNKKDFDAQETLLLEFLEFPESITKPKNRSNAHFKLAHLYQNKGEYDTAFNHLYSGLSIAKAQNSDPDIARAYYELGSLHYYREEYEKALENL